MHNSHAHEVCRGVETPSSVEQTDECTKRSVVGSVRAVDDLLSVLESENKSEN
jgi:hypothetical protein